MKATILVIEDEIEIAELIKLYLDKEGFEVVLAETAETGIVLFKKGVDLIVLDINLPDMDGFEFLQTIRKESEIPVIIVSARQDDSDMVLGLGIGADDYVTKPFSPKVLVARVRTNLRRYSFSEATAEADSQTLGREILKFADYTLDSEAYLLKKGNERVPLSLREFEVLIYLLRNAGKPSSPEEIYKNVWKNNYGDITTVGVHIQRIRKKLEKDPTAPAIIETVHSFGYIIRKEILS